MPANMAFSLHRTFGDFLEILNKVVDYLNNPCLVINMQTYFGIKYKIANKSVNKHITGKNKSDTSAGSSLCLNSETVKEKTIGEEDIAYQINNIFWYYFFFFGTALGDEIFYATFFPFWLWNIDVSVGRKFILVWSSCMYIGQILKELMRWPRPGFPVLKLQKKWALEYGMPSTHAMVGVAMPFSILIFTNGRYQYPTNFGVLMAFSCCSLICVSRIYLGMHSILDVVVGVLLASLMMVFLIPCVNWIDDFLITNYYSPIIVIFTSITLLFYHPIADKWTPTRGDSTIIVSVCSGGFVGCWLNYHSGYTESHKRPYEVSQATSALIIITCLRTIIGFIATFATKIFFKSLSETTVAFLLKKTKAEIKGSENSLVNKSKIIMDLCSKYVTYGMIAFNTLFTIPLLFSWLKIN